MAHRCKDGVQSENQTWWMYDNRGIPLCRVCNVCSVQKMSKYRPEIRRPVEFNPWTQSATGLKRDDPDYDYSDVYDF